MANIDGALLEAQVDTITNEVISRLTKAGTLTVEVSTPGGETYFKKFARGAFHHVDADGNMSIAGWNATPSPTTGQLSLASSGLMKIQSGHALLIHAEDGMTTGGTVKSGEDAKSISILANGDIHIEAKGPGGIYIKSPGDLRLEGDNVQIVGKTGVSINTGSQETVEGEINSVGSGDLSISTGRLRVSAKQKTEQIQTLKKTVNYGQVVTEQKVALTEPTLPQQHLMSHSTPGSIEHVVDGDYILKVKGKMLVKVDGIALPASPLNGAGATQAETYRTEVAGDKGTYIQPGVASPGGVAQGSDYTEITKGKHHVKVIAGDTESQTAVAFEVTKDNIVHTIVGDGDMAFGVQGFGDIAINNASGDLLVETRSILLTAQAEVRLQGTNIYLN